jgi:mRNA interferase HigB
MHVISHRKFIDFYSIHPDTKASLENFYKIIAKTNFDNFNHLKQTFPSADQVDNCTVFNVGGNNVRIIAAIHYNLHKIYIRHVLSHTDYNEGKWKKKCQRLH